MRGEYGLWNVEIYSRARQNTPQPPWFDDKCVVKLCVNFGRGVMVTMEAFKEYDDTPSAQRLKSSEISYQAWQAQASELKSLSILSRARAGQDLKVNHASSGSSLMEGLSR